MKIDRVILAVDSNPNYTFFWNIVSKVWKEKFNINPTLIFYGTQDEFNQKGFIVDGFDYKILNPINEVSDPSPNWVVPWSLFWGASQYENDVCLLSGMDQIPIGHYFFEKLRDINDENFVVGFADAYIKYNKDTLGYFNTKSNIMYPSSHLVGKGKLFKKIFQIEESFETEVKKVYSKKEDYYLNNHYYSNSKLWGLDECYASDKIESFSEQNKIEKLKIFWDYWLPKRIDLMGKINHNFDVNLLDKGDYSELTCKGYKSHKDKIDLILKNIKNFVF